MHDYIRRLRSLIGNMEVVIPGVRALLTSSEGELLLLRRGDFRNWGLPAGVVDVGESALAALGREVEEETGLRILRAEPFGIYTDPKYRVIYPNGDRVQTFTVAFLVHEWQGELAADGDEALELGFFPLDAMPEPLYPIHRDCIEDFRLHRGRFIVK